MNGQNDMYIPNCPEFVRGYQLYNQRERLAPLWFNARRIVQENWGDASQMAQGVNIIIRGWNRFYARYDNNALITTINSHLHTLSDLRYRDISSYIEDDKTILLILFNDFEESLKRTSDKRRSPVSVAKALSLFASGFLPIWDSNISITYNCFYVYRGSNEYIAFIEHMKRFAEHVNRCVPIDDDRTLLKRIDEYNYSKYTMHWI